MFGFGGKKYRVKVTTGKAKGAGTNATIKITLIDHEGKKSGEKTLDKFLHKDFQYGKIDTYTVTADEDFGKFKNCLKFCGGVQPQSTFLLIL